MKTTTVQSLWEQYIAENPEFASLSVPKSLRFGDNEQQADGLAKLVIKDLKRAISYTLLGLQLRKEGLPKIGDFMVITDAKGDAKCIVRSVAVKLVPYFSIKPEQAKWECLGDKGIEHWKQLVWERSAAELEAFGRKPKESMIMVFQRFEKVYEP
ncbi:MAG: ASCH domain-containing protein [Bacteroidota bacterium]